MTEAKPAADKSPEELRAELSAKRAELGHLVGPGEELVGDLRDRFRELRLGFDTVEERKRELGNSIRNVNSFLMLVGFASLSPYKERAAYRTMVTRSGRSANSSTTRERLPEGFQTAEFQKEHGMVDRIVHRLALRDDLERLLGFVA